ncbi:MAG: hypothetical protein E7342_01720 [Clostridiales bacterium]|nr:hypothetical protein [Clostridiales bacterium]
MAKGEGIFSKLIMGSEKTEEQARAALPSNRWELFWDILKGSFGKVIGLNLLVLLFCIPIFLLAIYNNATLSYYASQGTFSQGLGVGYPGITSLVGLSESLEVQVSYQYIFLPLFSLIGAVGLAGGAYVAKNMVWTEGIFVVSDFWRGIKKNFGTIMCVALFYSVLFFLLNLSISYLGLVYVVTTNKVIKVFSIISKVFAIVTIVFITMISMYMLTIGVTYKCTFWQLLKNSTILTWALLPRNIFFGAIALIPFILLLFKGAMSTVAISVIIILGISWFLLVWTNYSQWVFDEHINDKVEGAKKNRGIYEKVKNDNAKSLEKYKETLIHAGRSKLSTRPIRPIDEDKEELAILPTSFSRADLQKLQDSKNAIYKEIDDYVEEHKNDEQYKISEEDKKAEELKEKRIKEAEKALKINKKKKK